MRYYKCLFLIVFFSSISLFSQEKYTKHTVSKGETISKIAQHYNVKPDAIYELNPVAVNGIQLKSVLLIPTKAKNKKDSTHQIVSNFPEKTHQVLAKETVYGIAKKCNISVAELYKINPELEKEGLKIGQKINIPIKADAISILAEEKIAEKKVVDNKEIKANSEVAILPQTEVDEKNLETQISHKVLPKETKYGIAKQYSISVAELEKQNPNSANKLLVGSVLKIRSAKVIEKEVTEESEVVLETSAVNEKLDAKDTNLNRVHDAAFLDQLVQKATENIGSRYRTGGITKDGFDCSGLMCATFGNFDIRLPRTSIEMSSYGTKIDAENAQKGDLIFFKTNGRRQINHVGMVVEVLDGEIKFIHASIHGGVMISSTKESYYEKNLAQINRVL